MPSLSLPLDFVALWGGGNFMFLCWMPLWCLSPLNRSQISPLCSFCFRIFAILLFLCFCWIGHFIIDKSYWHKSVLIIIVRFFPLESHSVIFNVTKAITGVVVVLLQCCSRKFIESATFIFAGIEMLRWVRISMIFSSCFERN